jgi:hypothetical protein
MKKRFLLQAHDHHGCSPYPDKIFKSELEAIIYFEENTPRERRYSGCIMNNKFNRVALLLDDDGLDWVVLGLLDSKDS